MRLRPLLAPLGFVTLLFTAAARDPQAALPKQASPAPQQAAAPLAFVPARPDGVTAKVVAAAEALLAAVSEEQRAKLVFAMDDEEQRARWSNLPTGMFARTGLRMGDLSEAQRAAVHTLLRALLSADGHRQIVENIAGEQQLVRPGQRGAVVFGEDEFYVSFLGRPSLTEAFGVQFGGHHLALNATVVGERIVLTPSLTGGQPMNFTVEGRAIAQMAAELRDAYALVASLDEAQRAVAVRAARPIDLTWGPGRESAADEVRKRAPEGIAASALDEAQRALLVQIIAARVNLLNDEDAAVELSRLTARLDEATFAWFGPTERGGVASYRVHGPEVFIEYAPQGSGPAANEHVHAIYRDTRNDYGRALARN
jgi:hypothetical protein